MRSNRWQFVFFFLVLILLAFSSGCSIQNSENTLFDQNWQKKEELYEKQPHIKKNLRRCYESCQIVYTEAEGTSGFIADMEYFVIDNVCFSFESSINENEREKCIKSTLLFLSTFAFSKQFNIYVFEPNTFPGIEIRDHEIYLSNIPWLSPEYGTVLLLAEYGASSWYGLAYGYVCLMCKDLSWFESYNKLQTDNLDLLSVADLNLLCFKSPYSSAQEISCAQYLSQEVVSYLIMEKGQEEFLEILKNSQDYNQIHNTCNYLEEYYQKIGLLYTPLPILIRYGGYCFDYVAETEYGTFFIGKKWQEPTVGDNPTVYDGFLHKNYADIKQFFEINISQISMLMEHMLRETYQAVNLREAAIVFENFSNPAQIGGKTSSGKIRINSVCSLLHEYVHLITITINKSFPPYAWMNEGYATYYESTIPNYYENIYMSLMWNEELPSTSENLQNAWTAYNGEENPPIDFDRDALILWDLISLINQETVPNTDFAGASFCGFIANTYGEEKLNLYLFGERDTYFLFQVGSIQELYPIWYQSLIDTYEVLIQTN